jgi:hypothetical protein
MLLLLEKPRLAVRPILIRAASSVWLTRRRHVVRDLRRRAAWAAEARTAPTLGFWTELMDGSRDPPDGGDRGS